MPPFPFSYVTNFSDSNFRNHTSHTPISSDGRSSSSTEVKPCSPIQTTEEKGTSGVERKYIPIIEKDQLVVDLNADSPESEEPEEENKRVTRCMHGISKPKVPYVGSTTVTSKTNVSISKPQSISEALNIPEWKSAMHEEISALKRNNTWSLVPYSSNLKIVDFKWIYKTKFKASGEVERYKARLVAKVFQQNPGINCRTLLVQ